MSVSASQRSGGGASASNPYRRLDVHPGAPQALRFHDALEVVAYHFPTGFMVSLFILANMVINNSGYCEGPTKRTVTGIICIHAILAFLSKFLDKYSASNGQRYYVILIPFYGPMCPMLPTEEDKDRVWENYRLNAGDYFLAVGMGVLVPAMSILSQPVAMCLYPAYNQHWWGRNYFKNGHTKMGAAVVAAGPIFVVLLSFLIMLCIQPRRNGWGRDIVPETCPVADAVEMNTNPAYEARGGTGTGASFSEGERSGRSFQDEYPVANKAAASMDPTASEQYNAQYGNGNYAA